MKNKSSSSIYVQYGCGMSAPTSWVNFDSSPTLYFERIPIIGHVYTKNGTRFPKNVRYGDIVKGLPLPEGSCAGIYASHVLEHLALEDLRIALRNTFNILMPGGIFRLIVPDLEVAVMKYVNSKTADAAENLLRETMLGRTVRQKTLKGFFSTFLGQSEHLWMWDYKGLARELSAIGFSEIRPSQIGDSEDHMFRALEDPKRFVDSIAVQCRRPST